MGNLPTFTHKRIGFHRQCQEKWRGESQSCLLGNRCWNGRDYANASRCRKKRNYDHDLIFPERDAGALHREIDEVPQ